MANKNGRLAQENGLSARKWKIQTVLFWLAFEIPVVIASYSYTNNVLINSISGSLAGILGYFVAKSRLEKAMAIQDEGHKNDF